MKSRCKQVVVHERGDAKATPSIKRGKLFFKYYTKRSVTRNEGKQFWG